MKQLLFFLAISFATFSMAQSDSSVVTKVVVEEKGDSVILKAQFDVSENWMVYDSIIGEGGPVPLSFAFTTMTNLKLVSVTKPHLHKKHDEIFEVDMLYFKENVEYVYVFKKVNSTENSTLGGTFEYMCCNLVSGVCLAPRVEDISYAK